MDQILEKTEIILPKSMIDAELQQEWQSMLQRMGAREEQILPFLQKDGNSKEEIMEKWTPDAEKKIKHQLIMGKLIELEKLEASDGEIDEEISKRAADSGISEEEYKNSIGEARLKQYLKNEIVMKKLFDFLLENAKITKGEKIKYADLIKGESV
jgi:trigger factor